MNKKEWQIRLDLCEAGRRLYLAGLTAGTEGNLSALLNDDEVLVTPSNTCKGYMDPSDLIKVNRQGKVISGDRPPTVEVPMHLATYEERPDISTVIHCHPPYLVAFTIAQVAIPSGVIPEVEHTFGGGIPLAPYGMPGTSDLADTVRALIREHDVILLDHHGILAVGNELMHVEALAEQAEAAARTVAYAMQLGKVTPLSKENIEHLLHIYQAKRNKR